jgi:hypothetical protein
MVYKNVKYIGVKYLGYILIASGCFTIQSFNIQMRRCLSIFDNIFLIQR